jgi:CO/xanthine dehydrogenase Mo-binding subunit
MAIGQRVPMVDAIERVSGRIDYALNVRLPGMLVGRILRSPYPHARIVRIDASRAEALPGVLAVLTRNDLLDEDRIFPYFGPVIRDQGIVAIDKVRFTGDVVAAVAALDDDIAAEALDLIDVEYEELPWVTDEVEAMQPGAPVVHEHLPRAAASFGDIVLHTEEGTNACNRFTLRKGDVEQGFKEADLVFEDVFRSPPVQHVPMETHVAVAQVEGSKITVWTGTQTPHIVRAQVAEVFKVPVSQVRIVVHTLGGGYGAKCYAKVEPLAAVLAWKARRPVKLVLRRDEEFQTVTKHGATIRLKTGVKRDGTLVAQEATCYYNTGAYADIGPRLIKNGGYSTVGPYKVPHVKADSYAVYTNVVPAGAFRGFGISQGAWAYECQMDMIAERLRLDPIAFRRKNLLHDGDTFTTGQVVSDLHYDELLDNAISALAMYEPNGHGPGRAEGRGRHAVADRTDGGRWRRGRAVTCTIKSTVTPSTSSALAKLNEDGSLNVLTSSVEMGQGAKTALAQIAAHYGDLPLDRVRVSEPDTDVTPYDQQTSSSRTTFSMGEAIKLAVREVKRELLEIAADQLEVSPDDLTTADGRVFLSGMPSRGRSYGEVVAGSRRGNLLGRGTFVTEGGLDADTGQGIASARWLQAAAACEVEVDTETGKIQVLFFHANTYTGRMINPRQCELQIEGSTAFGLGQALFEEMVYEDGRLANANLSDYAIPSFEDLPRDQSTFGLERPGTEEVYGIGETSLPAVMPVIANAVYNAIGVRITDLPITPEKVLRALQR